MTTMNKVTIKGHPRDYSEAELIQLQEQRKAVYQFTENYEYVKADLALHFLQAVIEKEKEGFQLCNKTPVSMLPGSFRVRMIKPESQQQAELEAIYQQVKEQYVADLQKERENYKALLVQQLMEAEDEKERKRQEQAKAEKLAKFEQQAAECYGELKVPSESE